MSAEDRIIAPLTYAGKPGCQDVRCRVRPVGDGWECVGWHCVYCDAPCSYQGHSCDASTALIEESRRIPDEKEKDR